MTAEYISPTDPRWKPWSMTTGRGWTQAEVDTAARTACQERAAGNFRAAQTYEFTARWAVATTPGLRLPSEIAP